MSPSDTDLPATLAHLNAQVLVRGWLSANSIVFCHQGRGQVVDTGYLSHAAQTLALVDQSLAGTPLHEVVNTHLHSDHCGGNAPLALRWPGLRITVPAASKDKLQPWDDSRLSYRATGQRCEPFEAHAFLADGDTLWLGGQAWQVHAAGGHDADAVMLFEPATRTLISGDALWQHRLAIIFPELEDEPGFESTRQTLARIEQLAPRWVLPGHGEPFSDVAAALGASRQRLAAFTAAPQRHRQHAVRSLLVYHLLEHRARPLDALTAWLTDTPLLRRALQAADDGAQAGDAAHRVVQRLLADGVLAAETRDGEAWVLLARGD